jgi:4-amino-4-deoxy-L-arabinose transferase-like glycosyltransferase
MLAFALIPAVAVALAIGGVRVPPFVISAWLVAAGLLGAVALVAVPDRRVVAVIVGGAIAVRLALGAVLLTYFHDAVFRVFDDTQRYIEIGARIADGWRAGTPPDLFEIYRLTVAGYYYIVAALRYVVGPDELAIVAFNSTLVALTAGLVYQLADRLGAAPRERIIAVAIASFAPSVVFWSALPLKDTPITLILVAGLIAALELVGRRGFLALGALLATIVLMSWFRLYATLFISLAAFAVIVLSRAWRRQPLWSLTVAVLVVAVQIWTFQSPVGRQVSLAATDLNELDRQRELFDRGASSVGGGGEPGLPWQIFVTSPTPSASVAGVSPSSSQLPSSTVAPAPTPTSTPKPTRSPPANTAERIERYAELALQEPLFVLQYLALPVPFLTRGTLVVIAMPEMLLWYALFPVSIFGLWLLLRRRQAPAIVLGLVTLAMAAVYGTIVSNAGSIMRYRAQAIVLLAIPMAVGIVWIWRRFRARRAASRR